MPESTERYRRKEIMGMNGPTYTYQRISDCAWIGISSPPSGPYQDFLDWETNGGIVEEYEATAEDEAWDTACGSR